MAAKIVFGMNQSLDGYVNHEALPVPGPKLFQHFIDRIAALSGSIYGRRMYGLMRYWDDDRPEWGEAERAFALAWRKQPKWVVSRTSEPVGPNASLIEGDLGAAVRRLKADHDGIIEVAGPKVAQRLTDLGLVDEYWLYLHPVVLGQGEPFFAGPRPPLRLVSSEMMDDQVIGLTYAPA